MIKNEDKLKKNTLYNNNGNRSFMIICSEDNPELPYQLNMIRYNQIEGLLSVQFIIEDGNYRYFYDISNMSSIDTWIGNKRYSIKDIRNIMSDLYICVQRLEEYLLDLNCIVLEPEYIFRDRKTGKFKFCFYPDKQGNFDESVERLFDYFLNHLEYKDENSVSVIYRIHQKSKESNLPFSELMKEFCACENNDSVTKCNDISYSDSDFNKNNNEKYYENQSEEYNKQCNYNSDDKKYYDGNNNGEHIRNDDLAGILSDESDKFERKSKFNFLSLFSYVPNVVCGYLMAMLMFYWYIHRKTLSIYFEIAICLALAGLLCISVILPGIMKKVIYKDKSKIKMKVKLKSKEYEEYDFTEENKYDHIRDNERGIDRLGDYERDNERGIDRSGDYVKDNERGIDRSGDYVKDNERGIDRSGDYVKDNKRGIDIRDTHLYLKDENRCVDNRENFRERNIAANEDGYYKKYKTVDCINEFKDYTEYVDKEQFNKVEDEFSRGYKSKEKFDNDCREKSYNDYKSDNDYRVDLNEKFNANNINATVVMSERELFKAFNPVLVSKDKDKFNDIILKDRSVIIGKIRGITDICLDSDGISRVHARINRDEDGCSLIDIGSTNGTYVNGERIKERQKVYLKDGDEIRFSEAAFTFLNTNGRTDA